MKTKIETPEQTFTLSEVIAWPTLYKLASLHIKVTGVYYCLWDGKKTKITK